MFLQMLTEKTEQNFFLKFAYLLAVAENDGGTDKIPTRAKIEKPEANEYSFEEFALGFPMQTSELLMLRQFAEEMGMTWDTVSSYDANESFFQLFAGTIDVPPSNFSVDDSTVPLQAIIAVAKQQSVPGMLKVAAEVLHNTPDRAAILKLVLEALFTRAKSSDFSLEKRKVILMEATAMASADGAVSDCEKALLVRFCELFCLEKELLDDFSGIVQKLYSAYSKALELITE